jgi:hypothetical protein
MYRVMAVVVMCTVLSAGCSSVIVPAVKPTLNPTAGVGLLSDNTCDKPCLLGIIPGKTIQSEAWTILKGNNKFVRDCNRYDVEDGYPPRLSIVCDSKSSDSISMSVYVRNTAGIVDEIWIEPYRLNVGQLISKYGTPDYTSVPLMRNNPSARPSVVGAALIYRKISTLVYLVGKEEPQYQMTPSTGVVAIVFATGNTLLAAETMSDQGPTALIPWRGYGMYSP